MHSRKQEVLFYYDFISFIVTLLAISVSRMTFSYHEGIPCFDSSYQSSSLFGIYWVWNVPDMAVLHISILIAIKAVVLLAASCSVDSNVVIITQQYSTDYK